MRTHAPASIHSGSFLALTAALALAACGDAGGGGGGPTAPTQPVATCQAGLTVDLPVGGTRVLSDGEAACFRLAPHPSAQYALAAFDARSVEAARTGPEPSLSQDAAYSLGDGSQIAPIQLPSASRASASIHPTDLTVVHSEAPAENDPFVRATPWTAGERFPVKRVDRNETATARVVRVFGGRYVFAVVEADAVSGTQKVIDDTEAAMEFMMREGLGVLDRAFGARRPVTSEGSGQVLVLFAGWNPDHGAGAATTWAAQDGSGVRTYLWINLQMRPGARDGWDYTGFPSFRLKVLAHELTHAWQSRYAYETQDGPRRGITFGPAWALEGSADLVAMDLVRRYLGIGLASNWNWAAQVRTGGKGVAYALEPADTRGNLARGYFDASSFLRDVQVRLTRRGLPADDALAEVARGAVEGWFGIDGAGVRRRGLADRVGSALGRSWDPSEAVLLWTATQALDDQTSAADLNNATYERAADPGSDYAWRPVVDDVRTGRAFAYQFSRAPGSSFFVRLKDDGTGGTLSARSATPGTRWMIARGR